MLVPPLLWGPALVLAFWWLVLALGLRVLRWLRGASDGLTLWEEGFLALSLGVGILPNIPYALAACGCLRPRWIALCLAALAIALAGDLARVARAVVRTLAATFARRRTWPEVIWAFLLAALAAVFLVRALSLGPMSDDDGYHLSAPKRWLESGTLAYLPTYTTTNASMGFELLYAIGLAAGAIPALKLLHFSAGVFTLVGFWLASRRLGAGLAGRVTISLLLVANPLWNLPFIFGLAYVDFGACWMTMAVVLLWLLWLERREPVLLVCMALCAGFAGSFKATAMVVSIAWAPVLVWDARRNGLSWARTLAGGVGLGLVAIGPMLPWFYRSWRLTGNPLFPLFSNVIPTRDWNPQVASVFGRFLHYYSWGIAAGLRLGEPARRSIVEVTALVVLAIAVTAFVRLRDFRLRSLTVFAGVFLMFAVLMGGMVFRYWLPGLLCAALLVAVAAAWRATSNRWPDRGLSWAAVVILALGLVVDVRQQATLSPFGRDLRVATGISTLDEAYAADPAWQMWQFLNAHTPPDARVLFAAFYASYSASSYGGFWVDRTCFTTDSHMQVYIRLDDWDGFLDSVRKAGIDYVVISEKEYPTNRFGYSFPARANEYAFCRHLVDAFGERVAQFDTFQLFRVQLPAPTRS
jgi:hypothetical protein